MTSHLALIFTLLEIGTLGKGKSFFEVEKQSFSPKESRPCYLGVNRGSKGYQEQQALSKNFRFYFAILRELHQLNNFRIGF